MSPFRPPVRIPPENEQFEKGGGKGDIVLFLASAAGSRYPWPVPRTARASVGGLVYHVLNRGNDRRTVFHEGGDYAAFLKLVAELAAGGEAGTGRPPVRVLAACLMPNHFHLVLWPRDDGDLSRAMGRLTTAHVRRYRRHHGGSGHVWQGRFKAFAVEQDGHLYAVLRYVERNPLRAGLVGRAQDWPWGTLALRTDPARPAWLSPWPVGDGSPPSDWAEFVNAPQTEAEVAALERSLRRERPYGGEAWARRTAARLGMTHTLRPRGRPRKADLATAETAETAETAAA